MKSGALSDKAYRRAPAARPGAHSAAAWRAACDLLPDGLCLLDGKRRVLQHNRAFAELLQADPGTLQGRALTSLLPGSLRLTRHPSAETPLGDRFLRLTLHPLANGSTTLLHVADITHEKRIERALQRSERQAAVGRLAGTLAHEINNPVAAVSNALFLLERDAAFDPASREYLGIAQQELKRVSRVVRRALSFYRDSGGPVEVSPARVMDDVLELHARQIQARAVRIRKRYDFRGDILSFPADLRHVLCNVLQNALEAVPRGGTIRVRISRARGQGGPAGGVRLVIADDGAGIPRPLRQRARQPFFTTKPGGASGLGLWIAESILRERGGSLHLRSAVPGTQRGLAVSIVLPQAEPRYGAVRPARPRLAVMRAGA